MMSMQTDTHLPGTLGPLYSGISLELYKLPRAKNFHIPVIVMAAVLLVVEGLAQQQSFLPISQIKPGMSGTGKTTFEKVAIEEFEVEILGILENVRPGRNLILSRLKGPRVEKTGVFSGMSGSPVYIDGKLIGAVAFAFPFSKEPIAGITPIHEMLKVFEGASTPARWFSSRSFSNRAADLGRMQPVVDVSRTIALELNQVGLAGELAPILTPLSLSGFDPAAVRFFDSNLRSLGLLPTLGISSSSDDFGDAPVAPGATLVAQLVRGDLEIGAAGTITHVDGARVYAFGHPFVGTGFTDMPMATGAVITVISSLSTSQKVTAVGDLVGSIKQDRDTGILGLRGEKPRMLPLSIRLRTSREGVREINVELVRGSFLSPLLANFAVFNSLVSSERSTGPQTFRVETRIRVTGQPEVIYSRNASQMAEAAVSVGGVLDLLMNTGFDDVPVENVNVQIQAVEEDLAARLEQVWVDRHEVRAGEKVQLKMVLRLDSGKTILQEYELQIPEGLKEGAIQVLVGEGVSVARSEASKDAGQFIPQTIYQLVRAINSVKKNDRLYVRLFREQPGVVVAGEGLPLLPPSMLEIHRSERTAGASRPLHNVVYLETELAASDLVLEGIKTIQLMVKG